MSSNFKSRWLKTGLHILSATLLTATLCVGPALAGGDGKNSDAVRLLNTIPIPVTAAALHGFDISWIDADTQRYYLADRSCPLGWEPSGEDFFSPCLAEADAVRRVLPRSEFARWFNAFLPALRLTPAKVTDPADGRLAHLDGLNLSRAWMLEGIAEALGKANPRYVALKRVASEHREAGLSSVTGEHYAGGHWLASFAVYLATARGLASK
jgi:hypothetical protein